MKNSVVSTASPNIALVKYWGKSNNAINRPNNDSVSITLNDQQLSTKTEIAFDSNIDSDSVWINKIEQKQNDQNEKTSFMFNIIREMKELAGVKEKIKVLSYNSFPTSSGLASSASGAAALVYGLNSLFELNLSGIDMSKLARRISGSACRSLFGGFVVWHKGSKEDGSDSFAEQIAPKSHWKDIIDIIYIVDESKKKISSSQGHSLTATTSPLYKLRPEFANKNAENAIKAIKAKDFDSLAEIIMRDSNNMHATMLDTWPPIRYMVDKSWQIIESIHELNDSKGCNIAAYTFDAGPNPHIITLKENEAEVKSAIGQYIKEIPWVYSVEIGDGPKIIDLK